MTGEMSTTGQKRWREVESLQDIPYVGPAIAADFRAIGVEHPRQLVGRDPYEMYEQLQAATGHRHDPLL